MHGPDDATRESRINPRRFGERTWFDMPGTSSRCREAGRRRIRTHAHRPVAGELLARSRV